MSTQNAGVSLYRPYIPDTAIRLQKSDTLGDTKADTPSLKSLAIKYLSNEKMIRPAIQLPIHSGKKCIAADVGGDTPSLSPTTTLQPEPTTVAHNAAKERKRMTTTYEIAKATYDAACEALNAVESRSADAIHRRDELRAMVKDLEAERRRLLAEVATNGPSGGNAKEQSANKSALAAAKEELADAEEAAGMFSDPISQAVEGVRDAHSALETALRRAATAEYDAVCAALVETAGPLIAKALALYPATRAGWYAATAKDLLESLKLHHVEPGQDVYERPTLPVAAETRRGLPPTNPPERQIAGVRSSHMDAAARVLNEQRTQQRDRMFGAR